MIEDVVIATEPAVVPVAPDLTPESESLPTRGGGVLRFEVDDCGVFDPAVDFSDNSGFHGLAVAHEIHAGLSSVVDGTPPTVELALAGRHEVSEDRLRHEFELRPGLRFSDGSPVLASDVVWSWERALRKSTPPSEARVVFGNVVGAAEFLEDEDAGISGLRVIDDRRLSVELTAPDPVLLYRLARPAAYVLSESDASEWDANFQNDERFPHNTLVNRGGYISSLPVGAGPFALTEYSDPRRSFGRDVTSPTGEQCVLLPNRHYWRDGEPLLDAVIADVVPGLGIDFLAKVTRQSGRFTAGELDLADANISYIFEEAGTNQPHSVLDAPERVRYRFLIFNPDVPPMDDLEQRRALVRVAPFETEFEFATRARRIIPERLIPAGSDAPAMAWMESGSDDPGAIRLRGREVFHYGFVPEPGWLLEAVFGAWVDELGVDLSFEVEPSTYVTRTPPLVDRQMVDFEFSTTSPLPGEVFRAAFNAFETDDPPALIAELRDELARSELEVDLAVRFAGVLEMERRLMDEALVLPLISQESGANLALQPWVNGLQISPFGGSRFAGVWLSPDAPERVVPEGAP